MNIKMKCLTFILPLALCVNSAFAKQDFSAIDRFVIQAKKDIGLQSGTAVAIVKDGKIVYEGYFGYADIQAKKQVTGETAFYIASITKPIFALSSLLMEHKGDIKESTSMAEMFPKMKFDHIDAEKVQLKHLISHTAAVSNWPFIVNTAYTGLHDNALRHKLVAATTPSDGVELGEYKYTNLGYNILSVWVDDFYQQDWQQTLAESVYQPLKMHRTSSYMSDANKKGFEVALPYGLNSKNPEQALSFMKSDSTMHGAGGTITTAPDLARFLIAQLNDGKVDGEQIFPSEVIKKSHQQLASCELNYGGFVRKGYAWGWYIGPYKDETMYHHFGGIAGTHSHASFIPEHNIGLVVINNEASASSALTGAIADLAYSILLNKGDADAIAAQHQEKIVKRMAKAKVNLKKYRETMASRTMELTQDKASYTGTFSNPMMGDVKVELTSSNQYKFSLGGLEAVATAFKEPDTMRLEFIAGNGIVAFYDVKDGKITSLKFFGESFKKL